MPTEENNSAPRQDAVNAAEYRPDVLFGEDSLPDPRSLAEAIRETLERRNASDLSLLRLPDRSDLCEYIIICTATSATHLRALADEVEYRLGLAGVKADSRDGRGDGQNWIVIDYGSSMVHIFTPEARSFYNIDRLFRNAEPVAD